uniref:DM2 domain-containing protein n=1 Tax=Xenopus laevis TaxID=8355 RepID=Q6PHL8_XENLA|nr:Unknown (protein for MGC:68495) [Xenopus laevis]
MSTSTALHLMDEQDPAPTTIQNTEESLVRVQPALLKILQSAGAKGDMFTLKQVMHYLGQYIMVKGLYDKQHQHIVHCGSDELGKLLGITTFSVKDPRPLYDMLKKNLLRISCTGRYLITYVNLLICFLVVLAGA